jgi:hypothetical protein
MRCCGCGRSVRRRRPATACWRRRPDAKQRPALARERLDEAYVLGQIDEAEYQRKRAVLEGIVPESAQPRSRAKKTVED